MRMYDLIVKKKKGLALNNDEISFIITGFTNGQIPDYQMSAFLMAVCLKGMNDEETTNFTIAMAHSGDILDLSEINGIKVDKHSTGGVGDKTSLVVGPIIACLGIPVAKMSGRGLGHTGGTIDKLESIKGFRTLLSKDEFIKNVKNINIALAGQTANLAPADKKIYALRDVTATVDNISLIASSIMSKKLASGADSIVLDVKCGNGAFMHNLEEAKKLAETMVKIGKDAGKNTIAIITDMNQPLGNSVGNALEVIEAVETLKGNGPRDFANLCYQLCAYMLVAAGYSNDLDKSLKDVYDVIKSGKALDKFKNWIETQGGDVSFIDDYTKLPMANIVYELKANSKGYIKEINTQQIGIAVYTLGGGRIVKDDVIDEAVGIVFNKKIGDRVNENDIIATIYGNDKNKLNLAIDILKDSISITKGKVNVPTLIKDIIR